MFALLVIRDAWVGDDAYITLRTVDNWVNGRGLVWNLGERVQAYTHPLWMLVLTAIYAFTREGYYTLLVPSVLCSIATAAVCARWLVPKGPAGWAVLALLPLSRAFVDYSTSGLENPLTHLLLAGSLAVWLVRAPGLPTVTALAALAGLALTNRMDTALLVGPLLAAAVVEARDAGRRALIGRVALGLLPFFAWEAFSLVYYGALVPNTALAKLNTGIPRSELVEQGLFYLLDGLERDPLTMAALIGGLSLPWALRDRSRVAAAGGIAYLAWVVWIGGDFMTGRFLAAPFLVAVACLGRMPLPNAHAAVFAAVALIVSFGADLPTLAPVTTAPPPELWKPDARGIADERAFYAFGGNGLASASRVKSMPGHRWRDVGEESPEGHLLLVQALGMRGWAGAPTNFLLDPLALTDPFLARLPSRYDPHWRVGHFERGIPPGYLQAIATRRDRWEDPELAALYGAVRRVTRGPIWSRERFVDIWRLHTGHYEFDHDRYRYADAVEVLPGPPTSPTDQSLTRADVVQLPGSGAHVALGGPAQVKWLFVRRRANVDMQVLFYRDGAVVAERDLPHSIPKGDWLAADWLEVPDRAAASGYDALRILPVEGPEPWSLLSVELMTKKTTPVDLVAMSGLPKGLRSLLARGKEDDPLVVTEEPDEAPSAPPYDKLDARKPLPRPKN